MLMLPIMMMMIFILRCLWLLQLSIHSAFNVALSFNPDLSMDICVCVFFIFSSLISPTSINLSVVHLPYCGCRGGIV